MQLTDGKIGDWNICDLLQDFIFAHVLFIHEVQV